MRASSRRQEETGGGQLEGGGQVQKGEEDGRRREDKDDRSVLQKLGRPTQTLRSWVILRSATAAGAAECKDRRRVAMQRRE